jgi:hypothetical protein
MVQTQRSIAQSKSSSIGERVGALDWPAIIANLDDHGCATTEPLLTVEECTVLAESYDSDQLFRSRIVMARHGFGCGEYKYFAYSLPQIVATLRDSLYPALAEVANRWNKALGIDLTYPSTHAAYLRRCHADGQSKPTPLLLRYGPGDFNCLHQDIYGENIFRFRWHFCCLSRSAILPAASSCSPSKGRACNHAPKLYRSGRARA